MKKMKYLLLAFLLIVFSSGCGAQTSEGSKESFVDESNDQVKSEGVETNTANDSKSIRGKVYTKENLESGIYIIREEGFEKVDIDRGLPDGFYSLEDITTKPSDLPLGSYDIYTDAKTFDSDSFPTFSRNTVFAVKGKLASNYYFNRIATVGYTYNASVSVAGISSPVFGESDSKKISIPYAQIKKINGLEMDLQTFFALKTQQGMTRGNFYLVGDESFLDDRFTVGFFKDTDYIEEEFEMAYWVALGVERGQALYEMELRETYDGYFELRFPQDEDLKPGLYMIYFGDIPYFAWLVDESNDLVKENDREALRALADKDVNSAGLILTCFSVAIDNGLISKGTYTSAPPELAVLLERFPDSYCTPGDAEWSVIVEDDGVSQIRLNGVQIWPFPYYIDAVVPRGSAYDSMNTDTGINADTDIYTDTDIYADTDMVLYYVIVTAPDGYVNLRMGPGTDYSVICEISNGEILDVTDISDNGKWLHVNYYDVPGWVAASQVTR